MNSNKVEVVYTGEREENEKTNLLSQAKNAIVSNPMITQKEKKQVIDLLTSFSKEITVEDLKKLNGGNLSLDDYKEILGKYFYDNLLKGGLDSLKTLEEDGKDAKKIMKKNTTTSIKKEEYNGKIVAENDLENALKSV